ncbi:hypothetical protein [Ramlibacter sp.]|uniref:hypothetical protein n=1 Tax=Ramlibacter sp. TaxID=1917967 RepID=UPI002C3B425E|nr:hypothetical protein [Ramlibacter sp.]HWI83251.1 hypothetical protein [Ramlibacter sp.]
MKEIPKAASTERPQREGRAGKQAERGSGEGAASALATWREIERSRCECEPAAEVQPPGVERRRRRAGRPAQES